MSGQLTELFTGQWEGQTDTKDRAYPIFYIKAVENEQESKKAGKPVFEEVEYVKVKTFDKTLDVDCRVEDRHRRRWPQNYKAFKEDAEAPINGTPIGQWPLISELKRMELNSIGIRSVEDLADFPDGNIPERSNIHDLKRRARDWLQEAKGLGILSSLRTDNDNMKAELSELRVLVQKVSARNEILEEMLKPPAAPIIPQSSGEQREPIKKKRGRPRKDK